MKQTTTRWALAGTLGAAMMGASLVPAGAAEGVFAGLSGYWSGGGTVSVTNGSPERLRCKAEYAVDGSGTNLNQTLRCASDSYRFDVKSSLANRGGAVTGTWLETTRNAGGNVSGRVDEGTIAGTVSGAGFSAAISVTLHGNSQTVTIRPSGSTNIRDVSVTMRRS